MRAPSGRNSSAPTSTSTGGSAARNEARKLARRASPPVATPLQVGQGNSSPCVLATTASRNCGLRPPSAGMPRTDWPVPEKSAKKTRSNKTGMSSVPLPPKLNRRGGREDGRMSRREGEAKLRTWAPGKVWQGGPTGPQGQKPFLRPHTDSARLVRCVYAARMSVSGRPCKFFVKRGHKT